MKTHFLWMLALLLLGFFFQNCGNKKQNSSNNRWDEKGFSTHKSDSREAAKTPSASTPRTAPPPPPPPPAITENAHFDEAPIEFEDTSIEDIDFHQNEPTPDISNEDYQTPTENAFQTALDRPLSTFSIDVDKASYSNMRRFLNNNQLPPTDAVRIEELVNYFNYDYPEPTGKIPFSVSTEMSDCPWNPQHKLVQIGLKGKTVAKNQMPASNLVFLLDVSGSMGQPNKLPLLKSAFKLLTQQLRAEDRVSIVVYAGASGVILNPTSGRHTQQIMTALDRLEAGGGTAGAQGIQLAYQLAEKAFIPNGNNRVILATDGDFNIGIRNTDELIKLIENKRKSGIFLSVLGFGMGNYKDHRMEQIADKGNGNYAYIDNIREAKKVLVEEMTSTLFTIAKDVKIQVEFNPIKVHSYRLIGYENRMLKKEDFNDDTKDAGEIGAGHTVTALYEIVPKDAAEVTDSNVDELRYQTSRAKLASHITKEWMTVKLRYKDPKSEVSKKSVFRVANKGLKWQDTSDNFQFSAAVASFGMLLKDSEFKGNTSFQKIENWALNSLGKDEYGYRTEFMELVGKAKSIARYGR